MIRSFPFPIMGDSLDTVSETTIVLLKHKVCIVCAVVLYLIGHVLKAMYCTRLADTSMS
jgi:hypothetical protein